MAVSPGGVKHFKSIDAVSLKVRLMSVGVGCCDAPTPRDDSASPFLAWDPTRVTGIHLDLERALCAWCMVGVGDFFLLCRLDPKTRITVQSSSELVLHLPVFAQLEYKSDSPETEVVCWALHKEEQSALHALYAALDQVRGPYPQLQWEFPRGAEKSLTGIQARIKAETSVFCSQDWDKIIADLTPAGGQSPQRRDDVVGEQRPKKKHRGNPEGEGSERPEQERSQSSRKQQNPQQWASLGRIAPSYAGSPPLEQELKLWEEEKVRQLPDGTTIVWWKDSHYGGINGERDFHNDLAGFQGQWKECSNNGKTGDDFSASIKWRPTNESSGTVWDGRP